MIIYRLKNIELVRGEVYEPNKKEYYGDFNLLLSYVISSINQYYAYKSFELDYINNMFDLPDDVFDNLMSLKKEKDKIKLVMPNLTMEIEKFKFNHNNLDDLKTFFDDESFYLNTIDIVNNQKKVQSAILYINNKLYEGEFEKQSTNLLIGHLNITHLKHKIEYFEATAENKEYYRKFNNAKTEEERLDIIKDMKTYKNRIMDLKLEETIVFKFNYEKDKITKTFINKFKKLNFITDILDTDEYRNFYSDVMNEKLNLTYDIDNFIKQDMKDMKRVILIKSNINDMPKKYTAKESIEFILETYLIPEEYIDLSVEDFNIELKKYEKSRSKIENKLDYFIHLQQYIPEFLNLQNLQSVSEETYSEETLHINQDIAYESLLIDFENEGVYSGEEILKTEQNNFIKEIIVSSLEHFDQNIAVLQLMSMFSKRK